MVQNLKRLVEVKLIFSAKDAANSWKHARANQNQIVKIMQKMKNKDIIVISVILFITTVCHAQNVRIGGYEPNYYTQRVSADSLDKIFSKRIPLELEVKNCTLDDLTKHHWLSIYSKICGTGGYWIYTFHRNGKYQLCIGGSTGTKYEYKRTEERYYYLSDTPDLIFDDTKIGSEKGKYLIRRFNDNDSTVHISRVVKCSDGTLLEIYDNSSLYIYSHKPLKEPYEAVIKNGHLTIPFEDYGFIFYK